MLLEQRDHSPWLAFCSPLVVFCQFSRSLPRTGRSSTATRRRSLVRVLAGGLDDRRPAIDLAQQRTFGRLRRGAVLSHRFGADIVEALDHVGLLERSLERGGELLHNRRRCASWRPKAVPDGKLKTFQSGFVRGRN